MTKKLKSLNPIIGTGYKTLSMIKDGEDGNIENFPDTLPKIPRLSYKRLGVSGLEIGWEFEDKIYYTYELYGSTTKGFEASEENLMFQGLASSYFYEAKPGEKWYFKARAKNTHGRYTEFSSELVTYTVKLDNLGEYVEGGSINGALIENATINNAHIKDLHADKITAGVLDADRIGANSITANKIEANAITSEKIQANAITTDKLAANIITSSHIQSGTIESGHIKAGTIESGHIKADAIESDHIKSNSINSNHIQANTIQSEHIQTGAITAGSGIIAEGAIGSAQISSLDAAKIEAGTIDTSKVTIQGANGHLRLKGNRMQVFQGTGNQAKERVSVGDVNGDGSVYGLRVRGTDGQTILLDENGVKSEGITDGAITNDKISDDANIDGAKLNINSVVSKINEDGTETIQGTKIEVDGTTLNTKLSTITNKQTEDGERITQAQSQISANTNAIKLKVDEQTYSTDKADMTSKLNKNTSEISAMKGQIALKVEQTDITNAINNIEIGGRNYTQTTSTSSTIVGENKENQTIYPYPISNPTSLAGEKVTISFTYTVSNYQQGNFKPQTNGNPYRQGKAITPQGNGTFTYVYTDTYPSGFASAKMGFRIDNFIGTLVISNFKLEKGNKATDWIPAQEDIDANIDTKVNSAKAEIKVTTDAISQNVSNLSQTVSTKADGSTVSSLNSKVSSLETSVNGISGKVSSLEKTTTTLGTRVDTANTNASSALNKANSATTTANNAQNTANTNKSNITDLQGEVSTVKSNVASLEVTTSGISQKVSSVESTTATLTTKVNTAQNTADSAKSAAANAQSTANSANSKIDGLQVGGRNLALNTSTPLTLTNFTGASNYCTREYRVPIKGLELNDRLTISYDFEYTNLTKNSSAGIYLHGWGETSGWSNGVNIRDNFNIGNITWGTATKKTIRQKSYMIVNSTTLTDSEIYLRVRTDGITGGSFTVKNFKIEKGSKATDWTPAPEDVTQDATDKANKALSDAKNYTSLEISKTNSQVAEITTNLDRITQRVSSTESTTATLTNKVNTAQSTADNVSSKLNNLQIGARNLLKGTSSELKSVTFGGWDYYFPNNLTSWKVGGQLTGRVYIKPTNQEASCMLHVRYTDSTYSQYRGNVIKAGTEGYSTVTITVNPPNGKTVSHIQFSIRHSASNTPSDIVYYKEAKVESGSKATDWSPAPEDVASDINKAETKANNALEKKMGINLIVNQGTYAPNQPNKEGELYIHGFDANGNKADVDGYIINPNNGNKITIPKCAINANDKIPYNQEIYLCYSNRLWFAWYNTSDKKWKYLDANANSYEGTVNNLVWGDSHLVLGVVVASGAEMYTSGFLYDTPKNYRDAIGNTIEFTTTKSQVSTIETNLSGITSRVGTVETKQTKTDGKVTGLESRMSNAESKITESAITNTVKKNFYTKSETEGAITSKGYQTSSQVQQTVNGLEIKVKQSGGYNNLFNSGFKKGTSYWSEQLYGTATNKSISTWDDSNQYILPNTKALVIRATNPTDRYGVHQNVKVKEGATYSISALSAGHRNTKQLITIRKASDGTHIANIEANPIGAGKNINNWRKMEGIFTIPSGCTEITVCLYMVGTGNNSDAYVWYTNVLLSEGKIVNEWSPHPSEIYDGVTTIDKDGVTVTASNVKSKTNMSANGFKITKTDTNEDVFKVNSDGTLYMKGQITVTGGSVPTSNLSGTISSNQLNSSITSDINNAKNNASSALSTANTAKSTADSAKSTATSAQSTANTASTNATNALNTANSVNSTVNSNKNNWSNAYNRVKDWASGAVTGSTTINGGMITANTISVNKLAVGDFTNISQIDENLAPNGNTVITHSDNYKYFRFGNDSSAGYHSLHFATLNGGTFKVGDRFKFTFIGFGNKSISTAFIIRARYTDNTWNNLGSASYTFDTANKTRTVELQITSGLTAGKTLQRVQIFNEFSNTTGLVYMRNICINRMATGELIVDGSIKTSMIHSDGLNASVIKAGTISADRLDANTIVSKVNGGTTEINGNRIQTGTLSASKITTGTLDASKVTVTNLNASNIKSGKLSANYIDATNLAVKGSLISGQINGVGGMKFADGAVISSCESGVAGYKGIQISAPVVKLGDKVEINRPTIFYDVTGKNNSSSKTTTWTMSSSGGLNCSTVNTTGTTTVGGTLNVRNNMINGMNNLQMGRGSVYIPIFGTNYTYDYIKGGASRIAFADSGPIHFLYNGTRSSFVAGGTVYLPHAGNVNCDHFRLGAGIMASPSSGSFHFLTASGNTSPLYAGRLYSADVLYSNEPMVISNNSAFDKINSVNVIETKNGLNLHNPISTTNNIDESSDIVKTVYNEEKDEIKTSIDYTSAISTLWKAVQELKQENDELKEIIKDIHSKL